jgi:hypothetical protein
MKAFMRDLGGFIKGFFVDEIYGTFKELFIEFPRAIAREHQRRKYIRNLEYVIARLESPHHDDLDERDRKYKLEAVFWLREYYSGNSDFIADGPPELKLKKILSKPTRDVTLRDHVFTKVFYYWKEHRRVEGF